MEKHVSGLLIVIAVICLLVGGLVGYNMAPTKVVTETETEIVYKNVSVDKLVEVPTADISIYLNNAVEDFLDYIDDEELLTCGNYDYDFEEITVSRIYDSYSVEKDDKDYTVDFSIRLKYDEEDERSCRQSFDVTAFYEEDEDVEITIN